ncbi:hypothetical protein NITMOv2_4273 [Nitrospira moscoviensis]|uniref:Uncharacterized protein n=1 Tax=Nitrospira moscoviensis TaxID=42253 RepID=A0A0K2GI78_NITMO|nr:hypothetical protein NITMOv2_4273 [Nitrospira moscoviensis]
MSRQDDSPLSITPAIIHVRLSSEPLSPEKQEHVRQEVREILKRRQHYVDLARGQLRFNY